MDKYLVRDGGDTDAQWEELTFMVTERISRLLQPVCLILDNDLKYSWVSVDKLTKVGEVFGQLLFLDDEKAFRSDFN